MTERTADYGLYDFMAGRVIAHVAQRPELLRPIAEALAKEILAEIKRQKELEKPQIGKT